MGRQETSEVIVVLGVLRRWTVALGLAVAVLALVVPPAAQAEVLGDTDPLDPELRAWLEDNGPLRIGWTDFVGPTSIHEDGRVTGGFGVDLLDLAALKLGIELEHVVLGTPTDVVAALEAGEVDVAGAFAQRPDLLAVAESVGTLAWVPTGFVAGPERLEVVRQDFDGSTVTTIAGSPHEETLATRFPQLTYVETSGLQPGLQQVAEGSIDLYLGPYGLLGFALRDSEISLTPIGPVVAVEPVGPYAVPDTPQAEIVRAAVATLSGDEIALTTVRWTGFDLSDPADGTELPGWVVPTALTAFVVVLALVGFSVLLRRRVRVATSELRSLNDELEDRVEARTKELGDAAERLRRSNAALQRFASTAAHDLRGPVTAIAGLVDVGQRMSLGPEVQEDLMERVKRSTLSLSAMIDGMLEDAIEMGAQTDHLTGDDLESWLREVTAPEVDAVGAELEVDAPDGALDLDAEVLRRSTFNLVGNALKYAVNEAHGTVVRIRLRRVHDAWELQVHDNGPGVPKAMWSEIFDRGTRLAHDARGFGLGLASIRDIVQGSGGGIRVGDSDELGGACFTVTLPRTVRVDDGTSDGTTTADDPVERVSR